VRKSLSLANFAKSFAPRSSNQLSWGEFNTNIPTATRPSKSAFSPQQSPTTPSSQSPSNKSPGFFRAKLAQYDFLAANKQLIAQLATGRIKPAELLDAL